MSRAVLRRLIIFALLFILLFFVVRGSFVLSTLSFGGKYGVFGKSLSGKEYNLTATEMVWKCLITDGVQSRSVRFKGGEAEISELTERFKLVERARQELGDVKIIYGYTDTFSEYRMVSGKKVNMQIALSDGMVTVGVPLIMGSF